MSNQKFLQSVIVVEFMPLLRIRLKPFGLDDIPVSCGGLPKVKITVVSGMLFPFPFLPNALNLEVVLFFESLF